MSRGKDIARLEGLARLVLDHRLALLRKAAEQRQQSQMQLAALERNEGPSGLDAVAAGQVALRYQRWADVRRTELNAVLARQTAAWLDARHDAQRAFGQAEALAKLAERLGRKG
jgi:hypothetical protein